MFRSALVIVSVLCVGALAACPPHHPIHLTIQPGAEAEQCGWYYVGAGFELPQGSCCNMSTDVHPDKMRFNAYEPLSVYDNNNGGCKTLSNECIDWLFFYLCGINCSPKFTDYVVPEEEKALYPSGIKVCEKILKGVYENCKDQEWPVGYPVLTSGDAALQQYGQCQKFTDRFKNEYEMANGFGVKFVESADGCYNAASSLAPLSGLMALVAAFAALL